MVLGRSKYSPRVPDRLAPQVDVSQLLRPCKCRAALGGYSLYPGPRSKPVPGIWMGYIVMSHHWGGPQKVCCHCWHQGTARLLEQMNTSECYSGPVKNKWGVSASLEMVSLEETTPRPPNLGQCCWTMPIFYTVLPHKVTKGGPSTLNPLVALCTFSMINLKV